MAGKHWNRIMEGSVMSGRKGTRNLQAAPETSRKTVRSTELYLALTKREKCKVQNYENQTKRLLRK